MSDYLSILIPLFIIALCVSVFIQAFKQNRAKLDLANSKNDQDRFIRLPQYKGAELQRLRVSTYPGRQSARMKTRIVSIDASIPRNTSTVSYEEYLRVIILGKYTDKKIFWCAYTEENKEMLEDLIHKRDHF